MATKVKVKTKKPKNVLLNEAHELAEKVRAAEQERKQAESDCLTKARFETKALWRFGDWTKINIPTYGVGVATTKRAHEEGLLTVSEVASGTGFSESRIKKARETAAFWPETDRTDASFTRHYHAMVHNRGDLSAAKQWLLDNVPMDVADRVRMASEQSVVTRAKNSLRNPDRRQKVIEQLKDDGALEEVAGAIAEAAPEAVKRPTAKAVKSYLDTASKNEKTDITTYLLDDDDVAEAIEEDEIEVPEPTRPARAKPPKPDEGAISTLVLLMHLNGAIRRLRERLDSDFRSDENEDEMLDRIDKKLGDFTEQLTKAKQQVKHRRGKHLRAV